MGDIFVAAAAEADQDRPTIGILRAIRKDLGDRVSGLESRNDALQLGKTVKCGQRPIIVDGDVFGPPAVAQV